MRRDPSLIRELMLKLEAYPMESGGAVNFHRPYEELAVEGFSDDEVDYHLGQIRRSGFIDDFGSQPRVGFGFATLTPAGHDFIDSVRNPETWTKTKGAVEKAGGFTLSVLAETAKALIKHELQRIGLPL